MYQPTFVPNQAPMSMSTSSYEYVNQNTPLHNGIDVNYDVHAGVSMTTSGVSVSSSVLDSDQLSSIYTYILSLCDENVKLRDEVTDCKQIIDRNTDLLTNQQRQLKDIRNFNQSKMSDSRQVVLKLRDHNTDLNRKLSKMIDQNDVLSRENKDLIERRNKGGENVPKALHNGDMSPTKETNKSPTENSRNATDGNTQTKEVINLRKIVTQLQEKVDHLQTQNSKLLTRTVHTESPTKKPELSVQSTQTESETRFKKTNSADLEMEVAREIAILTSPKINHITEPPISISKTQPVSSYLNASPSSANGDSPRQVGANNMYASSAAGDSPRQGDCNNLYASPSSANGDSPRQASSLEPSSIATQEPVSRKVSVNNTKEEDQTIKLERDTLKKQVMHLLEENERLQKSVRDHWAANQFRTQKIEELTTRLAALDNQGPESEEVANLKSVILGYQEDFQVERQQFKRKREQDATVFNTLLRDYESVLKDFGDLKISTANDRRVSELKAELVACQELIRENNGKNDSLKFERDRAYNEATIARALSERNADAIKREQRRSDIMSKEKDHVVEQLNMLQIQHQQLLDEHERVSKHRLQEIQQRHAPASHSLNIPSMVSSLSWDNTTNPGQRSPTYSQVVREGMQHEEVTQEFRCPKCQKTFPEMDSLEMHVLECIT